MSEIPNTVSAPLPDVMAANTRYIVTLSTDGTTVKESLWTWPVGSMLIQNPDGSIQVVGSAGNLIPLACMDLTLALPLFYTAGTKSIGINSGSYDASGAAASAQAFAIQRANHTGTQIASTISDFTAASIAAVTWSTLTGKPTLATVATSGVYSDLTGKPSLGTQMSADTGWTANNTAGDKTAALSSYSNGLNGTMVTALNVVSGGTGTALSAAMDVLVIVVKKLAAIETVLVSSKLPNA